MRNDIPLAPAIKRRSERPLTVSEARVGHQGRVAGVDLARGREGAALAAPGRLESTSCGKGGKQRAKRRKAKKAMGEGGFYIYDGHGRACEILKILLQPGG